MVTDAPPDAASVIREMRDALEAAIRAANLAVFVQGVLPNSSWEAGFEKDLATANAALARAKQLDIERAVGVIMTGECRCQVCAEPTHLLIPLRPPTSGGGDE